jgi:hypothetical protein
MNILLTSDCACLFNGVLLGLEHRAALSRQAPQGVPSEPKLAPATEGPPKSLSHVYGADEVLTKSLLPASQPVAIPLDHTSIPTCLDKEPVSAPSILHFFMALLASHG